MISTAYKLFTMEADRLVRRDDLWKRITQHIMDHLPDAANTDVERRGRGAEMLLNHLDQISRVSDIESLERHLVFLESLPDKVDFFDFHNFIDLADDHQEHTEAHGRFLYKVYLSIEGFAGSYDVREGVLGLCAYHHLSPLLDSESGETASIALIKAALRLNEFEHRFTSSHMFPYSNGTERVGYHLNDFALATMIACHPERVDEIIEAVVSRGAFLGAEVTLGIIDSEAQALTAGIL